MNDVYVYYYYLTYQLKHLGYLSEWKTCARSGGCACSAAAVLTTLMQGASARQRIYLCSEVRPSLLVFRSLVLKYLCEVGRDRLLVRLNPQLFLWLSVSQINLPPKPGVPEPGVEPALSSLTITSNNHNTS